MLEQLKVDYQTVFSRRQIKGNINKKKKRKRKIINI